MTTYSIVLARSWYVRLGILGCKFDPHRPYPNAVRGQRNAEEIRASLVSKLPDNREYGFTLAACACWIRPRAMAEADLPARHPASTRRAAAVARPQQSPSRQTAQLIGL